MLTHTQAQVQLLYEETFLSEGRLSNIVQLLGYHPTYVNLFIKTHDFLMRGNGPLPLDIRNYIAILVGVVWGHCNREMGEVIRKVDSVIEESKATCTRSAPSLLRNY